MSHNNLRCIILLLLLQIVNARGAQDQSFKAYIFRCFSVRAVKLLTSSLAMDASSE